jgi:hypothetical protein
MKEHVMTAPMLQIDDAGVRREVGDRKVEQVTWDGLVEVCILTTSEGPFAEDVFIVLVGVGGAGCAVPLGAPESTQLLERLQRLPGFDYKAVIRAMQSTGEEKFVCWRRPVPDIES